MGNRKKRSNGLTRPSGTYLRSQKWLKRLCWNGRKETIHKPERTTMDLMWPRKMNSWFPATRFTFDFVLFFFSDSFFFVNVHVHSLHQWRLKETRDLNSVETFFYYTFEINDSLEYSSISFRFSYGRTLFLCTFTKMLIYRQPITGIDSHDYSMKRSSSSVIGTERISWFRCELARSVIKTCSQVKVKTIQNDQRTTKERSAQREGRPAWSPSASRPYRTENQSIGLSFAYHHERLDQTWWVVAISGATNTAKNWHSQLLRYRHASDEFPRGQEEARKQLLLVGRPSHFRFIHGVRKCVQSDGAGQCHGANGQKRGDTFPCSFASDAATRDEHRFGFRSGQNCASTDSIRS